MDQAKTPAETLSAPVPGVEALQYPVEISIKSLMAAGAHYGHQTEKWNPKMLPYVYCAKNGIHIINLDISLDQWRKARQFIVDTVSRGGNLLFAGTKQQAREFVAFEAQRCGAFYVNTRWLGGTLSNFQTIKNSIDRMRRLEELLIKANDETSGVKISKKEKLYIRRELAKLEVSLGGIRGMKKQPEVLFVVDIIKEAIAVAEARRLRIPVVALVDTNVDPEVVTYPIACNDDATRTVRLMLAAVGDAVLEGKAAWELRRPKDMVAAAPAEAEEKPAAVEMGSAEAGAVA